jgi:hypothetical protein
MLRSFNLRAKPTGRNTCNQHMAMQYADSDDDSYSETESRENETPIRPNRTAPAPYRLSNGSSRSPCRDLRVDHRFSHSGVLGPETSPPEANSAPFRMRNCLQRTCFWATLIHLARSYSILGRTSILKNGLLCCRCFRLQAVVKYRYIAGYSATSRYKRSHSIITPSKKNSSATNYFARSCYERNYSILTLFKRSSSATSHFTLSRYERSCNITNLLRGILLLPIFLQ